MLLHVKAFVASEIPSFYDVSLFGYPLILKRTEIMLCRVVKSGGEVWQST